MYHYLTDKEFLKKMRGVCSNLVNQLVQLINKESVMRVKAHLVGSGARNLETQNGNEPVDLDYNLLIKDISNELDINDGQKIKEYIRVKLNTILKNNELPDSQDSTSVLSTRYLYLINDDKNKFKIDLAIVFKDSDGTWYRLIHEKTGIISTDRWYWNEGPNSKGLESKVKFLKDNHYWGQLRSTYLEKKNMYLRRNDYNHSSFNCYIESVNELYQKYN